MKRREFLERWGLSELRVCLGFLGAAAWDLYVELLPRVTTQHMAPDPGDEKTALESIYSLFPLTRDILKQHGSGKLDDTSRMLREYHVRVWERPGGRFPGPTRQREEQNARH
jgi:hypothetical protein